MKKCINCNSEMLDKETVCPHCNAVNEQNSFSSSPISVVEQLGGINESGLSDFVKKKIKQIGGSGVHLSYWLLTLINMILGALVIRLSVKTIYNIGFDMQIEETNMFLFSLIAYLVISLPAILSLLGSIVFYICSKTKNKTGVAGLNMISISQVISIILYALYCVIMTVFMIFVVTQIKKMDIVSLLQELQIPYIETVENINSIVTIATLALWGLCVLLSVLSIIYCLKIISGCSTVKQVMKFGKSDKRFPIYPAIYLIFTALVVLVSFASQIALAFGLFNEIVNPTMIPLLSKVQLLLSLLMIFISFVTVILKIILLFKTRNANNKN